jgi:WD40 repeat protein
MTGHTGGVAAVAAVVLPDGRPVAVTASWDATVRVWDLAEVASCGYPLELPEPAQAIAVWPASDRVGVVVAGETMLARVDFGGLV